MSQAQDDLVARASDPNAELTTLHELANNYPGLRPYIAENPRTYPSLLEWLGSLGDPAVDAALARRNLAAATVAVDQSTVKTAIALAETSSPPQSLATGSGRVSDAETLALAGGWQSAEQAPQARPAQPQPTSYQQPAAAGSGYQRPAAPGSSYPRPATAGAGYQQAAPQGGTYPGARPQTVPHQPGVAAGPVAQQPAHGAPESNVFGVGTAVAEEKDRTGRSGMWLWILAGVVLVVVVAIAVWFMTSDRGDAAATQTTAAQPTPPAQNPAPEPSQKPTPSQSPTPELKAPAPADAVQLNTFISPSGNISCTLGENSVSCTINQHDFIPADASCGNATSLPFTVSVGETGEASGNCSSEFSSQPNTLNYSASAASGIFACTSLETGIECWSQVSGEGFRLSRSDAQPITR